MPPLLHGRRIAVLGSASGLGLAVAAACAAAGAEVLGIDAEARFDHLAELYRADPTDPGAMDAVAAALPEGLDGLALFPALPDGTPALQLTHALAAPRRLVDLLAPRMTRGASIVVRGTATAPTRDASLGAIRAGASLRVTDTEGFAARWGLNTEPGRTPRLIGWAWHGWALANAHSWPGIRINTVIPSTPDGRLTPSATALAGLEATEGAAIAARATVFLLSDLSNGLTGASLAADGGVSAQMQTRLEGL
ncbi:MAG: hypothetical protein ACK4GT_09145 [Pararhodobacter sp.]